MSRDFVASVAQPSEHSAACQLLFAHLPETDRTRRIARAEQFFTTGEIDPRGFFVVRSDEEVVGAILVQLHPGGSALIWPPGVRDVSQRAAIENLLSQTAVNLFRSEQIKQAQVLLPLAERGRAEPLERVGFRYITQMAFLCRPIPGEPIRTREPTHSQLQLVLADVNRPVFLETLMATYEDTLDCPELNHTRTPEEILTGYRSQCREEPPDWWLAYSGSEVVGILMLGPGPQPGLRELNYLGLVPSARGQGLGLALLQFGISRSSFPGIEWLTLSVDVRNEPARKLYQNQSFRQYDLQDVFLWQPSE